ncbi:hypothetical protein AA0473_1017 [Acetobacter orleanensis NRIC 0473]|uniref:Uncharacterized protein n=1 Tax=Acetobacter orleanensis TaxID=104099 RepID=A0A4Y3TQ83_9PROT|nr:hypothetical protein Abol_036_015 [Acetobacter orleanensis JCM 7639]GBR25916.1 hypothetical protein AA0473_1017 [Acetobacter orleanensis NRIC 0473]GEB83934.1 hypothetical protein AOR01nite_24110 [Acetobacter orleanensis]
MNVCMGGYRLIHRPVDNGKAETDCSGGEDERQTVHGTNPFRVCGARADLPDTVMRVNRLLQNRSWHL